jgi:hypothetical protein
MVWTKASVRHTLQGGATSWVPHAKVGVCTRGQGREGGRVHAHRQYDTPTTVDRTPSGADNTARNKRRAAGVRRGGATPRHAPAILHQVREHAVQVARLLVEDAVARVAEGGEVDKVLGRGGGGGAAGVHVGGPQGVHAQAVLAAAVGGVVEELQQALRAGADLRGVGRATCHGAWEHGVGTWDPRHVR